MALDRRLFLRRLVAGGVAWSVANTFDPEFWLWTPGAKTIVIPEVLAPAGMELVQVLGYQVLRFGAQECVVARRTAWLSTGSGAPLGVTLMPMGSLGSLERIPVVGFADGQACVELHSRALEVAEPGGNILGTRARDGKFVMLSRFREDERPRVYPRTSRPIAPGDPGMLSSALRLGIRPEQPLSTDRVILP